MPGTYSYEELPENQIKLVSWNVNSLNAAMKKGFLEYVKAENPDILCLQETKLNQAPKDVLKKEYKYQYWPCCQSGKKGYAGTAILSRIEPLQVTYGLDDSDLDDEGRVITLEFEAYFLVACYIPNAGEKLVRLKFREEWDVKMSEMLDKLNAKKPVIWAGDLNVAHEEIDLARPAQNRNKTPGFTDAERAGFSKCLSLSSGAMVDTFRHLHPDQSTYTYFSYRFQCRKKNLGWRLDYFVVSEALVPKVVHSAPRCECYGASDHVPIVLILEK
ncbi:hypothetical protein K493DRAFT_239487 [Basidiobolus meristosporus CBS 931.73]|uniref:DNA repair nuclease/redox regulator APEX1 n=1 Tax=Basidiobolus meristosporus CBS 931.73 TaxID=1314790 RepID=A0A1Y1XE21_9FUNG|nr:hypothetical protein K493DRAFT_239487 [Basidiobolus meristosporus CBS 931.73]|eukprot:ORX84008.1 hypothetical protein K493DRAFT_239487 [Basidiobolus meristosporus CBS 931.73]